MGNSGKSSRGKLWLVVTALAGLMALAFASIAGAEPIEQQNPDEPKVDSPWQAGTCKSDPPPPGQCSVGTPTLFYETAAGHPPKGFTQFILKTTAGTLGPKPAETLKTVRVDLPRGLTVNPQASPEQCELAPGESPQTCATTAPGSQVGVSEVTATTTTVPLDGVTTTVPSVPVYNVVPNPGEPARFGFSVLSSDVFLEADVAWEDDFHEYFTIHVHPVELPGLPLPEPARILKNRLTFDGTAGDGTFITTPTTCLGESFDGSPFEHVYSTLLRADSVQDEDPNFPNGSPFIEAKIPLGHFPKDCDSIPYDPSIAADPNTATTDSPSGAVVDVELPEITGPTNQATSHTRRAEVTLPPWMGLNPSAANGLETCTDAQFNRNSRGPVACPAASKVGTVAIETPPLPAGALNGTVYVGQPLSRDPASGDLYRIFVVAESARYDISVRLVGNVKADPNTGRLTTVFDDTAHGGLPQAPLTSFRLDFDDGPRAPLTSPGFCGPHTATTLLTPWSSALGTIPVGEEGGPNPEALVSASGDFVLTEAPGGGACPKDLASRPFAPGFSAATDKPQGGAFSPFHTDILRSDGQQELKGVDVKLPPGLVAKLAGVDYCPESAIAAAATQAGATEAASPSCPASSRVGRAVVKSGTGPSPVTIEGKAYLAGPYHGAPLSLAIVTPATTGPFDLGTVVVRVALLLEPETARVSAVTDPIPHVYGGALLDIRSVSLNLDRRNFALNPTNCAPMAVEAALHGGGGDPSNPAAFTTAPASSPFQVKNCDRLDFKPKLFLRVFGSTRRTKNPKLRAIVKARDGDANIGRAAVTLPKSFILDQGNISKVCTRVQYAANDCPKNSRYGFARAFTPLLDKPLEGPVRLRSSNNVLPDLVASLHGQVDIDLVGRTDAIKGRIRNTFDTVPDVPVTKFVLVVKGGPKGILTNSDPICGKGAPKKLKAVARFKAQNGKKANMRPKIRRPCDKKKKGGGKKKGSARR